MSGDAGARGHAEESITPPTAAESAGFLLERNAELELLGRAIEGAAGGSGSAVFVGGPPGIGKTELLRAARKLATERDARVLYACGEDRLLDVAYGVARQLFESPLLRGSPPERRSLLEGPARIGAAALGFEPAPAAVSGPAGPDSAGAALHGLYWLVANLAADRPLLVAIDDAQWADEASLRMVGYLVRRVSQLPVVVVVAARTPAQGTGGSAVPLAELSADPQVPVCRLEPLSEAASAELVRAALGATAADEFCAACHRLTSGNPFLLGELVRDVAAEGVPTSVAGVSRIETLVPEAVSDAVFTRIARLTPKAGDLARAAAVLAGAGNLRRAARLVGISPEEAAAAADDLIRAEILASITPLEFRHPLIASAIKEDIGPARRATLHARASEILAAEDAPAETVASHLMLAGPAGRADTVAWLSSAAALAQARGAPEVAVRYLRRALEEPPPADRRRAILRQLGIAETIVGDGTAAEHLQAAHDPSSGRERIELARELARAYLVAGRLQDAEAVLTHAVTEAGNEERELRLRVEADLHAFAMMGAEGIRAARRLLRLSDEITGKTPAERLVLANLAYYAGGRGGAAEAVRLAQLALGEGSLLAEQTADSPEFHQAVFVLATSDRFDEAEQELEAAVADARERGSAWGFSLAMAGRALCALHRGRLSDAEADARSAAGVISERGWQAMVPIAHARLALALVERGDLEAADAALAEAWGQEEVPRLALFHEVLFTRGQLRLARRQAERALGDFQEGLESERAHGVETVAGTNFHSGIVQALLALGRREESLEMADRELFLAERYGTSTAIGTALRDRGLAAGIPERAELLRRAAREHASCPSRLEEARTLLALGTALRRANQRRDSREPLRRALDLADRCGAAALAGQAREELAASGARVRRIRLTGAEALTPSERRVAEMAAEGMSNPQIAQALFVTRKAVEAHLGSAYRKLEIRSRKELPRALEGPAADAA